MTEGRAPPAVRARLCLGVTGHRLSHPALAGRAQSVEAAIQRVLGVVEQAGAGFVEIRLHTMLADGVDQMAARVALEQEWDHVAPLPFGVALTAAIGASVQEASSQDRQDLLTQAQRAFAPEAEASSNANLAEFVRLAKVSHVFALSDSDEQLAKQWIEAGVDPVLQQRFEAVSSERYALAARISIEQSDVVIAVWDGGVRSLIGGTGHTIRQALEAGAPVIWIDPAAPDNLRVLNSQDDLLITSPARGPTDVDPTFELITGICARVSRELVADKRTRGAGRYHHERRRRGNGILWRGYRLIENWFGRVRDAKPSTPTALTVMFALPEAHGQSAWADAYVALKGISGQDDPWVAKLAVTFNARFGWADCVATELSDAYRGGMVLNFALAACAVLVGLIHAPLGSGEEWLFALGELLLVSTIMVITGLGVLRGWHERWLESRRIAEYLRHSFYLQPLGIMRPVGRWPQGLTSSWPEEYVRATLREVGLPRHNIDARYVSAVLFDVILPHVSAQMTYHREKGVRLHTVHRNLDRMSVTLFVLAFLLVAIHVSAHFLGFNFPDWLSSWFTFLGVAFPMLGATLSGIRFFGDFERFGSISDVAARNLEGLAARMEALKGRGEAVDYDTAARLARAVEMVFVEELGSWQAIFGGKHMGVPS